MDTAVLFMIFNRPHLANRVFDVIQKAKPEKLFVMADGPRKGNTDDANKCIETRRILDRVNWKCELYTLFFDDNQGCGYAVVKGINWFFEHVDQGIILEDDCLPDLSFFQYCDVLLEYYRDDPEVMHINGNNFNLDKLFIGDASYHFGSYPQAWGWASWKRAWNHFDFNINKWPEIKEKKALDHMKWKWYEQALQEDKYDNLYASNHKYTWDYQWHLVIFINHGLTIVPKVNLISNIGFGEDATHTKKFRKSCTEVETGSMVFPLKHPDEYKVDTRVDAVFRNIIIGNMKTYLFLLKRQLVHSIKYYLVEMNKN